MNITLYGNDSRLFACREKMSAISSDGTLFLLPIPSFRRGIPPPFAGIRPKSNDAVVGYGIPEDAYLSLTKDGAVLLDLEKDDAYQKRNAEMTALGVVSHLLSEAETAPFDLSVGIVGFGRIGEALLKILCALGAKLSVYTRNPDSQKDLLPLGMDVFASSPFSYHGEDVLVNTAPARLLGKNAFHAKMPLIYDVASGDCIEDGIPYQKLPALPLRLFKNSAVRLYCETVERFVAEEMP